LESPSQYRLDTLRPFGWRQFTVEPVEADRGRVYQLGCGEEMLGMPVAQLANRLELASPTREITRILPQQPGNPNRLKAAQGFACVVEHLSGLPPNRPLPEKFIGVLEDFLSELATLRDLVDGVPDPIDPLRGRH